MIKGYDGKPTTERRIIGRMLWQLALAILFLGAMSTFAIYIASPDEIATERSK